MPLSVPNLALNVFLFSVVCPLIQPMKNCHRRYYMQLVTINKLLLPTTTISMYLTSNRYKTTSSSQLFKFTRLRGLHNTISLFYSFLRGNCSRGGRPRGEVKKGGQRDDFTEYESKYLVSSTGEWK